MSVDTLNPQKRSQGDFAARMAADSYFADITILEQNRGATEDDVLQALSTLNEKVGKIGACVLVLMPELVPLNADSPGPEYKMRATIQVTVSPLFNDGDTGTGKSAEQIAAKVRQLLHRYQGGWGVWSFAGQEPVDPKNEGDVIYGVHFTRSATDPTYRKLAMPLFDPDEGALPVTVTITSDLGAEIYYTTDGSYPHPDNEAATLYSAPVELTEPTTLRAAAYRTGMQASNVTTKNFGPNYEFSDEFSDEFA